MKSDQDNALVEHFVQRWQVDASTASWMQTLGSDVIKELVPKFNPSSSSPQEVHGKLRAYAASIARSVANRNLMQSMIAESLSRSSKITISGLPKEATTETVTDLLCQHGQVLDVTMMMGSMPLAFSRFAEARMASPDQAKAAVDALNGTVPCGFALPIRMQIAAPDEAEPSERLHVRDLPVDSNEEILIQLFSPYGKVADVKMLDADMGCADGLAASRSAAIVRMCSLEDARLALSCLHGQTLEDSSQPLSVSFASSGQSQVSPLQLQPSQPNASGWGQCAPSRRLLQPKQPAFPPPPVLQQSQPVNPDHRTPPLPAVPHLVTASTFGIRTQMGAPTPLAGCLSTPGQAIGSSPTWNSQALPRPRPVNPTAKQSSIAVLGTAALQPAARPRPTSRAASPDRPKPTRASFLVSVDVKTEMPDNC